MNRKEVEEKIRRAFEIDRLLPYPRPENAKCFLGKLVIIPDTERSYEDIKEDGEKRIYLTTEDYNNWELVMTQWMPKLHGAQRAVVKYRCCGMGWKRIARTLKEKQITHREFGRTTLWKMFMHGLEEFC